MPYHKLKVDINKKINDITSVWNCGFAKRTIARSKNIYSWKDKKCTSYNMGFKKGKMSNTIDNILNINRQYKNKINKFDKIDKDWKSNKKILDFYIDFETMNHNIGQVVDNNSSDIIFMIGIGWEENSRWMFKNFILEQNNDMSELDMMNSFYDYINMKKNELGYNMVRFIHWTKAEPSFYNKFLKKHNQDFPTINFCDLNSLFLDNNIVIKGALDFKLKNIAYAMYMNKQIKSHWDSTNPCSNGLDAMYFAYMVYASGDIVNESNNIIKNIMKYNEIDCKVMWEILEYIRRL